MSTLLIKNASLVATMDKNENELKDVSIFCENGVIKEIGDCKKILRDVFNQIKVITVDKIQNVVSNYFNIPLSEMLSQRRSRPLARPRQIAMYLAKKMTTRSLPEIGRRFANRDHTTVIHAVKTISRLADQDDEMKKNINQIRSLLLEQQ